MSKVFVIGGGAAGMMAAIIAAERGNEVHIFEKNEKFGKKIYITGKGRCNLTNSCDADELLQSVKRNRKFLYSAFYNFTTEDTIAFFEKSGCSTKIERGNRVFPKSDHSSDVIAALVKRMKNARVQMHLNIKVESLLITCDKRGIRINSGEKTSQAFNSETPSRAFNSETPSRAFNSETLYAEQLIIATGGLSYPTTGSTGDGYEFAKQLDMEVTATVPSLVPLTIKEKYIMDLQGLSLRNVRIVIEQFTEKQKPIKLFEDFGEMLFTHFGVSGPLILSGSSYVAEAMLKEKRHNVSSEYKLTIDLKPALSFEQLEQRILRDFEISKNKQFKSILPGLFPTKLTPVMAELSNIPWDKRIHEITKEERRNFIFLIKQFPMTITGMRDYNEAVITKGGISVKEINPATMESKKIPRVYFVGEVLDLDAITGGFNLQIAWSTGYTAGMAIGEEEL